MDSEKDFHRKRRAFVILKSGILLAETGFSGAHVDLLVESGFSLEQAHELICCRPRGFSSGGSVFAYQGEDFTVLSAENEAVFKSYFPFFRQNGMLSEDGRAFSGMKTGKIGEIWTGLKEIQIS